jgi:hypothetical protein
MLLLQPNQANQTGRLTLFEGKSVLPTFTHYLLVLNRDDSGVPTSNKLAQVLNVTLDNARITTFTCTTVGLEYSGQYYYEVYGQNSASNIDPNNAAVVGLIERGSAIIADNGEYYIDNTTINTTTIYP